MVETNKVFVPELRFPEFSEDWETKKLEKFGRLIPGLTYAPSDVSDDGVLVLRSSNIQEEKITLEDTVFVNIDIPEDNLSQVGDILICVRNGSVRLIGKNARITEKLPKATHGAFMSVFRGDSNDFVYWLMKTKRYSRQVYEDLGARINSINSNNLKRYKFNAPKSYEEQQKIAAFLSAVDDKLTNLRRKRELLESYKHGLMQQLFSQQIRFKQDDGSDFPDWGNFKLDYIFERIKNGSSAEQLQGQGGVKITRIETISSGIIDLQKVGFAKYENSLGNYKLCRGDILFSNINSVKQIGKVAYYDVDEDLYHGMNLLLLRTKKELFNSRLIFELLRTSKLKQRFERICNKAVNQASINQTDLGKEEIFIPTDIREQQKIADFLQSVDNKIDAVAEQITQLGTFKKGLLQKLFV